VVRTPRVQMTSLIASGCRSGAAIAGGDRAIGGVGLGEGLVGRDGKKSVDLALHRRNPIQNGLGQLPGCDLFVFQKPMGFLDAQVVKFQDAESLFRFLSFQLTADAEGAGLTHHLGH